MKKAIYFIAGALAIVSFASCDMFELDNFDGPNAQVTGRLLDAKTGEKIGIEAATTATFSWATWSYVTSVDAGALVVVEQGWDGEQDQDWLVRYDGQYTNELIFAGDYVFSTKKLPCYESASNAFTIKEGRNKMDISLVPYCRILNPKVSYNAASKKIVATFSVELGDPSKANQITNVALCGNTQMIVGCNYQNLAKDDKGAKKQNVNPGETITLEIDMTASANADLFEYNRERYFRIAAMAGGNGNNGNNYYNFSPTYKMSADFSTVEEVVWDENEW